MGRGRSRDEVGSVTVELALGIPVLVVITAFAIWAASLGATYVRALDVAQTTARQVARGMQADPPPAGMVIDVQAEGDLVRATVSTNRVPPIPVLSGLDVVVRADAVAAMEGLPPTQEEP
jgi:hypothetical protein